MFNILASDESKYQHIMVVETGGEKKLFLDNIYQTTLPNDDYYNILLDGANSKDSVLILGGGDLTSIPVLTRKNISNFKIVEIDEKVIEICKIFCPVREERYSDNILIEDAFKFIQETGEWDVVAIDLLGFSDLNKLSNLLSPEEFLRLVISKTKKYFSGFIGCGINGLVSGMCLREWCLKEGVEEFYLLSDSANQIFFIARTGKSLRLTRTTLSRMMLYPMYLNIPKILQNRTLSEKLSYCSAL